MPEKLVSSEEVKKMTSVHIIDLSGMDPQILIEEIKGIESALPHGKIQGFNDILVIHNHPENIPDDVMEIISFLLNKGFETDSIMGRDGWVTYDLNW
jgi:hypothetical protein